jgi:Homeodomain-like domain/Protein of unknown function (DUF1013)
MSTPDSNVPVMRPLSLIRRPAVCFPREYVDMERVAELAELYADGGLDALPPPVAVDDGEGCFIRADGEHRLSALEQLGLESAGVIVVQAPPGREPMDFAYDVGLMAAATPDKPLTRAERQTAIARLLSERPQMSDRQIAELVGVSHQTVGRARQRGPLDQSQDAARRPYATSPEVAARRLLCAFQKLREARGMGFVDWLSGGDRTARRFADALDATFGEEAILQARLFIGWLDEAALLLEAKES